MHRGSPARSDPAAWPPVPIPPRDARASANGDRRPSRGRGRDPRSATAAPRRPAAPPPMSPMLSLLPRDHANPPNMVLAHRPPTICCGTTIVDPRFLANPLSCRIYSVGNRSRTSFKRLSALIIDCTGPPSKPTTAVRPWTREPLFMPHACRSQYRSGPAQLDGFLPVRSRAKVHGSQTFARWAVWAATLPLFLPLPAADSNLTRSAVGNAIGRASVVKCRSADLLT
jgi:hypothetical protein